MYISTLLPGPAHPVMHGNAAAGQATFASVCSTCHGATALGNPDVHAPPLQGRSDWYLVRQLQKFKAGWRGANASDMWGATMRAQAMMLDDSTMTNVVAYIQTLRGTGTAP
jgi:cytochrome c553